MEERPRDEEREERISVEIIADAHDSEEQAMGWHSYLAEQLSVPFLARCVLERRTSPLRVDDEVEIVGMAPEDECAHEMFVLTHWERGTLAVPLVQLEGIRVDDETRQAVEDWHYWVSCGYEL
jgi:hypothetical protein